MSNDNEDEKTPMSELISKFEEDDPLLQPDTSHFQIKKNGRRIEEGSERHQTYQDKARRPNIILMKVDMTESTNQEKSFIVGGFASHRWREKLLSNKLLENSFANSDSQSNLTPRRRVQI